LPQQPETASDSKHLLKAAFFDFGGTLYSYQNEGLSLGPIIREAAGRLGLQVDPGGLREVYAAASRASAMEFVPRPYYLHRDLFEDTYRRVLESLGGKPSPELLRWCHEEQRQRVFERFELRPDCIETLEGLRTAGLNVSVVSNIDDDYLDPMIERAGLDRLLDAWTSSEEARSCKPDPGIFRVALDKAGCSAEEVVFVGDSPGADIGGALALGMTTVLITELDTVPLDTGARYEPHHTIDNLIELLEICT
jgi:putative hydrolase of the HAD superfamily